MKKSSDLLPTLDHQTIDLITQTNNQPSLLYTLVAENRWKELWDLLSSDSIRTDNLGCLTPVYREIQAATQGNPLPAPVAAAPASEVSAPLTLPRALWENQIIPQLNLHEQLQLRRVNRAFYQLTAPLRQLRSEFGELFHGKLLEETLVKDGYFRHPESHRSDRFFNALETTQVHRFRGLSASREPRTQLSEAIGQRSLSRFI
jgi:hypothetical protein